MLAGVIYLVRREACGGRGKDRSDKFGEIGGQVPKVQVEVRASILWRRRIASREILVQSCSLAISHSPISVGESI